MAIVRGSIPRQGASDMVSRIEGVMGVTEAQIAKLKLLCERFGVPFIESDYAVNTGSWMRGWVEAWVGGSDQMGKTLFVGFDPDGSSHS
ncbi:hypothetical protein [Rhodococcus qingshengii]|uniref:hypothetical protein n=1 Tax=Rhodococcus qingshengii TaxID=334542 RepID=UPI0023B0CE49|nr:hypothetical protein [Rhodococcus qingshengii]